MGYEENARANDLLERGPNRVSLPRLSTQFGALGLMGAAAEISLLQVISKLAGVQACQIGGRPRGERVWGTGLIVRHSAQSRPPSRLGSIRYSMAALGSEPPFRAGT